MAKVGKKVEATDSPENSPLTWKDLSQESRAELAAKIFAEAEKQIIHKCGLRLVAQMAYLPEGAFPRIVLSELPVEQPTEDETKK